MPKAIATSTTAGDAAPASTRRQMLGGTVLAALTGGAFGAADVLPNPAHLSPELSGEDAVLLAACADFTAAHQQIRQMERDGAPEDVFGNTLDVMHTALIRVSGLQAITPTGLRAKAGVCRDVLAMDEPKASAGRFDGEPRRHDVLAASFLVDFLGVAEVPVPVPAPVSADAALLAACAEFDALERAYQATDFTCISNTPEDLASDAERSQITLAQVPMLNRMAELQAVTRAGQVARARSLILWKPDLLEDGPGDFGECLTAAIVRDLVEGA